MKNVQQTMRSINERLKMENLKPSDDISFVLALYASLHKWGFYSSFTFKDSDEADFELLKAFPMFAYYPGHCGMCEAFTKKDNISASCSICPLTHANMACDVAGSIYKRWTYNPTKENAHQMLLLIEDVLNVYLAITSKEGQTILSDPCGTDYSALEHVYTRMFGNTTKNQIEFEHRMFHEAFIIISDEAMQMNVCAEDYKEEAFAKMQVEKEHIQELKNTEHDIISDRIHTDSDYTDFNILRSFGTTGNDFLTHLIHINKDDTPDEHTMVDLDDLSIVKLIKSDFSEIKHGQFYISTYKTFDEFKLWLKEAPLGHIFDNIHCRNDHGLDFSARLNVDWGTKHFIPSNIAYVYRIEDYKLVR